MLCFLLQLVGLGAFRPSLRNVPSSHTRCRTSFRSICAQLPNVKATQGFSLEAEIEQAKSEGRRYNIDKSRLTPIERQQLRLRSKAIPMVADKEPLDIIFEDDSFLVVNKPSYLKMHPNHRFEGGSLLNRAIGHCGFMPFVVHRLDMHTTGVVVFAKKKELCKPIMEQFMGGCVKKEYLCLVDGFHKEPVGFSFTVDAPIQRHRISFVREVGTLGEDSKPAQTVFTILDKSLKEKMMLLLAAPLTGRTHQIRVHAKERSVPIVGDDLYNRKEHDLYSSYDEITAAAGDPSLSRYADNNPLRKGLKLHACRLTLKDPASNEPLVFCASPPPHMQALVSWSGMEIPLCPLLL